MAHNTVASFKVGQRVQLAPWTDSFMRGDRWAVVVRLTKERVVILSDKVGRERSVHPINLRDETGF